MAVSKARVAGSGYTVLTFNGKPIERLRGVNDSGQSPVANPEPIQGINDPYPTEIAFPNALGAGQITFTIYELWDSSAWQSLFEGRFANTNDLREVFQEQLNSGSFQIQKIITGPNGRGRVETYQGVVVTNISDAENIQLNTMTVPKTVTCYYTRKVTSRVG